MEVGTAPFDALVRTPLHDQLLGASPAIQEVNDLINRLAASRLTVLITGESGTGKDIAARLLHRQSPRQGKPFVKVNCPAIPEAILESELFGYERGAFTGARTSKPGRFELANNGTIFLDEIAETSTSIQSKLIHVLDGEPFMRIGGVHPINVDVRLVAATNMSLEEAVRDGRMREDVFFRLTEVVINLPPIRKRPEDIPLLAEHFNYNYCTKFDKEYQPIPALYVEQMKELEWKGNVRLLSACVKRYVSTGNPRTLLGEEHELSAPVEAPTIRNAAEEGPEPSAREIIPLKEATRRAVEVTEKALIQEALRYTLWNRRKAAKLLDISYSSLLRRIAAYNIGRTE